MAARAIDLQGHRGARGLAPENTLAGFARALAIGVTTIETDLAVTRDDVVVLAHDPRLNPDISRGPDGYWLTPPGPLIRDMTLAEVQRYDVGRIDASTSYARAFPQQQPADRARVPALADLLALDGLAGRPPPRFNLEIKCSPLAPGETPEPLAFARLVAAAVRAAGVAARTTIQSFDWRAVLAARALAPEIATACLTVDMPDESNLRALHDGASPWLAGLDRAHPGVALPALVRAAGAGTWSPHWHGLDAEDIAAAHVLGLRVVPWTVNVAADMARLIDFGVDGLITDYPDVARAVIAGKGLAVA